MRLNCTAQKQSAIWSEILRLGVVCIACIGLSVSTVAGARQQKQSHSPTQAHVEADSGIVIETDSQLPDTYPNAAYEFRFRSHGGVSRPRWALEKGPDKGILPPGLKLEEDGLLHGQPQRSGEFHFTLDVHDNSQPPVHKSFTLRVLSALSLNWKTEAHVSGSRIEGSAEVSNTTPDDIDLTFIVLAVPPNGRAVAIGYQHFPLQRGTINMELPFGESLPRGSYVIHVDAIGEVASRNVIHRERLQTSGPLQVVAGP